MFSHLPMWGASSAQTMPWLTATQVSATVKRRNPPQEIQPWVEDQDPPGKLKHPHGRVWKWWVSHGKPSSKWIGICNVSPFFALRWLPAHIAGGQTMAKKTLKGRPCYAADVTVMTHGSRERLTIWQRTNYIYIYTSSLVMSDVNP